MKGALVLRSGLVWRALAALQPRVEGGLHAPALAGLQAVEAWDLSPLL